MSVAWRSCLLLGTLVLLPASSVWADTLEQLFARANQAYFEGDHDAAVRDYEALAQAGVDDPDVAFNLGTAHAVQGQHGRAIWQFRRALALRPGFEAAKRSLRQSRELLGQRQARRTGEATVQTAPPLTAALVAPFTADGLAWALLLCVFGASLCWLALQRALQETWRIGLGLATVGFAVLAVAAAAGLALKTEVGRPGVAGIVLDPDMPLREGPGTSATVRSTLPEGSEVRVLANERSFLQLRTPTGAVGWAEAAQVGQL